MRALTQTTRPNELTWTPSNDPPKRFYMGAPTTETKPQGKAGQMSCKNMHKANLGSQLRIFDMGSFARGRPRPNEPTRTPSNDPLERSDKGEPGKGAARACTKPTSGHNLAFFIRACSPGRALTQKTRPNELTQTPLYDPTERFYMGTRMTEMKPQGRVGQRSCTNVHKATLESQLRIFDTHSFGQVRPHPSKLTRIPSNNSTE